MYDMQKRQKRSRFDHIPLLMPFANKVLKEQPGQNILVAGSGKLVHTLMQHQLVDEFRFMVHPVVLGSGKRLFTEGTEMVKLTLVETKAFKSGIVILHYQPEKKEGR